MASLSIEHRRPHLAVESCHAKTSDLRALLGSSVKLLGFPEPVSLLPLTLLGLRGFGGP